MASMWYIVVLFVICAFAQTTTYSDLSAVPTNKPIAGDYTGTLRPQVHFSPPVSNTVSLHSGVPVTI